jgi:branched-chain amino acid transport system permease protein
MQALLGGTLSRFRRPRPLEAVKGAVALGAFGAAALFPLFSNDQYTLDVLAQAGLFVLLGTGLNVVVALAGLLDLGYIAFWAVGGYTGALLASSHYGIHLPFLLTIPIAIGVTSVFAVIIGVPTLRLRGDYLAIVTLGFGEIVRISLVNTRGFSGGPSGVQDIDTPSIFGYSFGFFLRPYYYLILIACVVAMAVGYLIRNSATGVIWEALRDNEIAARTCGIRPLPNYLLAFGIGAAFAGVSGTIFAIKQAAISPGSFTVDQSFLVLSIVVLGGLTGHAGRVAIAALVVMVLPEVLRSVQEYRLVVFGPALVIVVIARERWRQIEQVLFFGVPRFVRQRLRVFRGVTE